MAASASRMAARSTTHGTPVKSCSSTRAGMKLISLASPPTSPRRHIMRCRRRETRLPSSLRSRFSSRILVENGRRETLPTPDSSSLARRKISYSAPPARNFAAAPKLFFAITQIIVAAAIRRLDCSRSIISQISADTPLVTKTAPSQTQVERLIASFDRDPTGARDQLRNILEKDPQSFQAGAIRVLRSAPHSRAGYCVIRLLVNSETLFWVVCDAALPREDAVAVARMALQVDPMADVKLAKKLVDALSAEVSSVEAARLMDVLETISQGSRIMPSLMRLLRQADPQLRSKAVLMIGRASHNVKWAHTRLADETLAHAPMRWNPCGTWIPLRRARCCAKLRATATIGWPRTPSLPCIAWAIAGRFLKCSKWPPPKRPCSRLRRLGNGRDGDPRFLGSVGRMMGDCTPMVRKRAFSALGRLKKVAAKTREGCEWRVAARVLSSSASSRHVCLEAAAWMAPRCPNSAPTQFLITEDGQLINTYQVVERSAAEPMAVTFLFPRAVELAAGAWIKGASRSLARKRSFDFWRVAYYLTDETAVHADAELPAFTSITDTAASELEMRRGN